MKQDLANRYLNYAERMEAEARRLWNEAAANPNLGGDWKNYAGWRCWRLAQVAMRRFMALSGRACRVTGRTVKFHGDAAIA